MFSEARQPAAKLWHLMRMLAFAIGCYVSAAAWSTPASPILSPDSLSTWLEPSRTAKIEEALAGSYQERGADSVFPLNSGNTLWIKLRLARPQGTPGLWTVNIPLPFIDFVTLYQRDTAGVWQAQTAGDTVAHDQWSYHTLHPTFEVDLPDDKPHTVYLQIRNYTRTGIPLRIATDTVQEGLQTAEFLALGAAIGVLLSVAGISLFRYLEYRYRSDLSAMVYALVAGMAIAQINGVLNATVFVNLPWLADTGSKVLPTIAVGYSLIYIRQIYARSIHYHRFDRFMGVIGWIAIVSSGLVLPLMPEQIRTTESVLFATTSVVAMMATFYSWRAGAVIWPWLALATVPQGLGILWYAAEYAGFLPPVWERRYISSAGILLSVPMLAYALSQITRDRKDRLQRTKLLGTQDALTGLLNLQAFEPLVATALERVRNERETVALILVRLTNLSSVVAKFDSSIGEKCELQAVVKLHRVLRDIDPACRVGPGAFALLLEGVRSREQVRVRMTELLESGRKPQPGVLPSIALEFHAACVLLHEQPLEPAMALEDLGALLNTMRTGTRRPIRFIEAARTQPVGLQA